MADAAPVFHVGLIFGPMLIGVFFNMILYGVLLCQMYFYFQTYKSDMIWIRILVLYIFLVETANTAIDMAMMFQPLITGYGTAKAVANFPTLFLMEPIIIVMISTPIQCFFAWRIYKITKAYWIPAIIVFLSLASTTGGFITGIKIAILKLFSKKPELHWSALLWFLTSCVADLLITATLVRSLSKRKTGFSLTDSLVDKLIRTTVETGMITAICAIGDVACFMALPHTAINFVWDLALTKLYANCLMSNLNARANLMAQTQSVSSGAYRNALTSPMDSRRAHTSLRFASDNSVPGVYELDSTKTFEAVQSQNSHLYRGEESELEVTVTKVVQTLEDPVSRY